MQRRKFLAAAATAAALPLTLVATATPPAPAAGRQLIELRTYTMQFGGSGRQVLLTYLRDALQPALARHGVKSFRLMKPLGDEEPGQLYVLIAYPDANTYVAAQDLSGDADYQQAAAEYHAVPAGRPVYSRFTSQLLHAFSRLPEVADPGEEAGLFELRTYEGYSEDAVRRKIKMFNVEEIDLFYEVGLHPVFFGEMISGPYRPSLVYMLHFRDMEERNANWGKFGPHPKWKKMLANPEYADSVSNIRKTFLVPV